MPAVPIPRDARFDDNNLVWVDMEMSGLNPDSDRVLEIAVVVTDSALEVIAEGPVLVVQQSDSVLAGMDAWNQATHRRSGLIDRVRASRLEESEAAAQLLEFLAPYVGVGKSPMCGNSICQDRRLWRAGCPRSKPSFIIAIWM